MNIPRLNIAIPRPASDRIAIDLATIAGISTCHLHTLKTNHHDLYSTKTISNSRSVCCILERDQRPNNAKEAGISIRVPNKLPPHHNQNELRHDTCRRHSCRLGIWSNLCIEFSSRARAKLG